MRWRGLAVGLCCLVVAASVVAQERNAAKSASKQAVDSTKKGGSWLTRWLPFGGPEETKKETSAKEMPEPESAASVRACELAALQRRQALCLRLKEIAHQTNDEALAQKADRLDQLAWQVYEQRTRNAVVSTGGLTTGAER